jgi:hypothetical protein
MEAEDNPDPAGFIFLSQNNGNDWTALISVSSLDEVEAETVKENNE